MTTKKKYKIDVQAYWNHMADGLAQLHWQDALRLALDADGAPARCRRRACGMQRHCHIHVEDGEKLDCGGGVIAPRTISTAGAALLFGVTLAISFGRHIAKDQADGRFDWAGDKRLRPPVQSE